MAVDNRSKTSRRLLGALARFTPALLSVLAIGLVANSPRSVFAYTPESPEVKALIKKASVFLRSDKAWDLDKQAGAQAALGMALVKGNIAGPDDPAVLRAVAAVREIIPDNDPRKVAIKNTPTEIYMTGLSIIFLVSLDPVKYKPEIDCLMQFLYAKQKRYGAWGYFDRDTGDTSMTQYGVLSSWEAKQAGYEVPPKVLDDVAEWLLKTQDASGGFRYQGEDTLDGPRHCMTVAGGGCIYILTDLFQIEMISRKKDELPSALKEVRKEASKSTTLNGTRVSKERLRDSQLRTIEWMKKNYTIDPKFEYQYYYLYALERYMSFREFVEQTPEKEPKWYNEGVEFLAKTQAEDGSWDNRCGKVAGTAFGVLFLIRATKKAIEHPKNFGAGLLIGGRGLPKPGSRMDIQNGQIVTKQDLGEADELMNLLDDTKEADYEKAIEMMAELPSQQVESLLSKHGEKLRQLTREEKPEARMAAVVALGKTRSLDNVPALIFALRDEDREVVIEARKSLERISRNPAGFGPKDDYNEEQRRNAIEKWKAWYLSLRPDADVDF